jgi:hypothetical protein
MGPVGRVLDGGSLSTFSGRHVKLSSTLVSAGNFFSLFVGSLWLSEGVTRSSKGKDTISSEHSSYKTFFET